MDFKTEGKSVVQDTRKNPGTHPKARLQWPRRVVRFAGAMRFVVPLVCDEVCAAGFAPCEVLPPTGAFCCVTGAGCVLAFCAKLSVGMMSATSDARKNFPESKTTTFLLRLPFPARVRPVRGARRPTPTDARTRRGIRPRPTSAPRQSD